MLSILQGDTLAASARDSCCHDRSSLSHVRKIGRCGPMEQKQLMEMFVEHFGPRLRSASAKDPAALCGECCRGLQGGEERIP